MDIESERLVSVDLKSGELDLAARQLGSQAAKFNNNDISEIQEKSQTNKDLSPYCLIALSPFNENLDEYSQLLDYIHTHKTADLFKLALRSGAIIAGASEAQLDEITEFGQYMGVAFQIADDILDVTSTFEEMGKTLGKDEQEGKLTYVSLYGLDKAKEDLNKMIDKCFEILGKNNLKSEIFEKILNKIRVV